MSTHPTPEELAVQEIMCLARMVETRRAALRWADPLTAMPDLIAARDALAAEVALQIGQAYTRGCLDTMEVAAGVEA